MMIKILKYCLIILLFNIFSIKQTMSYEEPKYKTIKTTKAVGRIFLKDGELPEESPLPPLPPKKEPTKDLNFLMASSISGASFLLPQGSLEPLFPLSFQDMDVF